MTEDHFPQSHPDDAGAPLIAGFRDYVDDAAFPCVGATSALKRQRMTFEICHDLGSPHSALKIADGLKKFSQRHPRSTLEPVSFVVLFRGDIGNEDEFHARLWRQLKAIHDVDSIRHGWDVDVDSDVTAADFSFSAGGRAFFVVGLHPSSSRLARRAPCPALVFNFHHQFEAMKATGQYDRMQAAIRKRDIALQGTINPVLARFGEASEALQYSGRPNVGSGCPFQRRAA